MFTINVRQLFLLTLITLFAMSCDSDSHESHEEDGLVVFGNDVTITMIEVEAHDEEDEHDEEECPHATCIFGFQFEEDGQESYTYRQFNLAIDGDIVINAGETKEFAVHFLDENGDELHEEDDGDGDSEEEHGMHIEIEGVNPGTTTFQIALMHGGHSDFTSLPIAVTVE
mgnify:CR=1 FL=1